MKYQLVLQWPASTIDDFDQLIAREDALIAGLSGAAVVDGHDMGSGEMNIFLLTDNPLRTFAEARRVLEAIAAVSSLVAGFRAQNADAYEPVWPPGSASFSVI